MKKAILVQFQYRDASNYKDFFELLIDLEQYPEAADLVADGEPEIKMGKYGTPTQDQFFGSKIHPYPYGDDDHNFLSVEEITEVIHIDEFKNKAQKIIRKFEKLIDQMPQKGDTTATCQRLTIQQALNELAYTVNGTTQKDLYKSQDEDDE